MSAALLLAAATLSWAWERPLDVAAPGRAGVTLDRDVYAQARLDLADLRVVDETGADVPYVLDRAPALERVRFQPAILNRSFVRGRSETLTLDFGQARPKCGLMLSLSGSNFRRRVVVEASDDKDAWTTLTDEAWVFAVPGAPAARYESVRFPENDQRFVRLSVLHGPEDPERLEITSVEAWSEPRPSGAQTTLTPKLSRFEDPKQRETLLVLQLGTRGQPFREVLVDAPEAAFFRAVSVEALRELPPARPGAAPSIQWVGLGEGAIYRYESGGRRYENPRLVVAGRERAIRLRVRNLDDRPLHVRGVSVIAPRERLLFEALPGRRYSLRYGAPEAEAPSFDLARTVVDAVEWGAQARPARLGSPLRIEPQEGRLLPWTERHPTVLWIVLIGVVLALSAVTWRALKQAG